MKTHSLRLHKDPFNKIRSGSKTIESRLNDKKRQAFQVGDALLFIDRESGEEVSATIMHLHHSPSFHDLFLNLPTEKFGGESPGALLQEISQFYSLEEQSQYGVVGIEFKLTQSLSTTLTAQNQTAVS